MVNFHSLKIAIVVGETSGDILGAGLIRALKTRIPHAHFVGVAGPLMRAEGCETWYEMEELEAIGIIEILSRLRHIFYIRTNLIRQFIKLKPDVFIGIDSPDFNIPLEANLKKQGIKTIHYVSPSIWAWRQKRIFKIGRSTDLVLVCFPFEKTLYNKFNVSCRFIGHAIADVMPLDPDRNMARDILGIPHSGRCLALLPGSRSFELEMLSGVFLKTAEILYNSYPNLRVIVPLVHDRHCKQFERIRAKVTPDIQVYLLNGNSREAMTASDATLLASGTATLECMLAKCPMVVGYRMNPFTFWIVKHLIKTKYVSLPNLLAGHELVKEFLQNECQPQILANALLPLLANSKIKCQVYDIFRKLHQKILYSADNQAADAVLEMIKQ